MIFIGYRRLDEPFGLGIPYSMLTEHFNTSHEVFLDTVPIAGIARLRPEARAAEGLVAALERQAAALTARTGLPITVTGPRSDSLFALKPRSISTGWPSKRSTTPSSMRTSGNSPCE